MFLQSQFSQLLQDILSRGKEIMLSCFRISFFHQVEFSSVIKAPVIWSRVPETALPPSRATLSSVYM